MNNRIHLTFTYKTELEDTLDTIFNQYEVFMNRVFVLDSLDDGKFLCTYNIHEEGLDIRIPNTILVHRKKQSNTLYTINALNELIKEINNGVMDSNFNIDWNQYRNTVLLYRNQQLEFLRTKLYKIIED